MARIFSLLLAAATLACLPVEAQTPPPVPGDSGTPPAAGAPPGPNVPAEAGGKPAPVKPAIPQVVTAESSAQLSVVRVNVTDQPYDFSKPWAKRNPYTRRALGALLSGGRVLVTGELVANSNYVEFEYADGSRKVPAVVEAVDYESNLAVLKTDDPDFLKTLTPLQLTPASVGDGLAVWQLENNGNLLATKGVMTTAEVSRYPQDDSLLLLYRVTASLQARDSSFTVPIVHDHRLVGMLARYDPQSSNVDVIPAPVIEHFLNDGAKPPYQGFPHAGMAFSAMRDPQLRRFAGLGPDVSGGVYVTEVLPGSPADSAGLLEGDVIVRVDHRPVDQDGNYLDATYGKIAVSHLLSTLHYVGDVIKMDILRKGTPKELMLTLAHRSPRDYVIDPYIIDRAPKFYILGGLVLQELSRQFLREWGGDWAKKAPIDFVHLDRQQNRLFKEPGRKVVFLSRILPTDATVGYEDLHYLVVTKINGQEIKSLADVPKAVGQVAHGVHKIEFDSDPQEIFLDAEQAKTAERILTKSYRLPSLQNLE